MFKSFLSSFKLTVQICSQWVRKVGVVRTPMTFQYSTCQLLDDFVSATLIPRSSLIFSLGHIIHYIMAAYCSCYCSIFVRVWFIN